MDAWCCGAGGGVKFGRHDYAVAVGKERDEEAISRGADVLVTACPVCIENCNGANESCKLKIAVLYLTELLGNSLA